MYYEYSETEGRIVRVDVEEEKKREAERAEKVKAMTQPKVPSWRDIQGKKDKGITMNLIT